ncbi:hypothetical protein MKW94_005173 [Papaver nudicaule]|uniref:Uncharacterized protein n=1 Tax=Papaver nudicaule TaxID=74823 RepID=A0AA41VCX4_PAPNU|nr:hypothetical protein [Papaver nudicaule]
MFLIPSTLPFEKLWDMFFDGHEGRFSVYMHASRERPVHDGRFSVYMHASREVVWGGTSMVDAERRLLGLAFQDPDNQHFVLLSDSCVPLHNFDYIEYKDFTKGSQSFTLKRQLYCRPCMDGDRNCYSDEHYFQTFFNMMDPGGIANWSVTQVDWSERKWHPKTYLA